MWDIFISTSQLKVWQFLWCPSQLDKKIIMRPYVAQAILGGKSKQSNQTKLYLAVSEWT